MLQQQRQTEMAHQQDCMQQGCLGMWTGVVGCQPWNILLDAKNHSGLIVGSLHQQMSKCDLNLPLKSKLSLHPLLWSKKDLKVLLNHKFLKYKRNLLQLIICAIYSTSP